MEMVDWDWETQGIETKQKRFKDFLQSNQWQEECIFQCCGQGRECLGLWREQLWRIGAGPTTQINSPQKNNNLSGIVAVAGGDSYFSMFLDKQGNIFTCGCNPIGQLGLGDKNDRHTPQKVNNIPPMSHILFLLAIQRCIICGLWIVKELWVQRLWAIGSGPHK